MDASKPGKKGILSSLSLLLPFLYRATSLIILCGFFLPWCGGASGFDFACTRSYFGLWGIVVVAVAFFLLPLLSLSLIRSLIGLIMGILVLAIMIRVSQRFGIFREYGVWVTLVGGGIGALTSLLELTLGQRSPPPPYLAPGKRVT